MQLRSRAQIVGVSAVYLVLAVGLATLSMQQILGAQQPLQLLALALALSLALLPPICWAALQHQRLALSQHQLRSQADSDPLTGLLNRPAFVQRSNQMLQQVAGDRPCTLLLLDLDFFPEFCETYGHPEADRVLQHFAAHLSARVREDDFFCRMDRESFALLLVGANLTQAARLANRMVASVEARPYSCNSNGTANILEFTASCGYADTTSERNFGQLYSNATSALLQAKRQGHNRAVAFQAAGAIANSSEPLDAQTT